MLVLLYDAFLHLTNVVICWSEERKEPSEDDRRLRQERAAAMADAGEVARRGLDQEMTAHERGTAAKTI